MITDTQELILKLIEKNSFNNFSGPSVARDLRENKTLWRSLLMTRFVRPVFQKLQNPAKSNPPPVSIDHRADLFPLRYLPGDHYSADTLIIHTEPGQQDHLEALGKRWQADTADWILGDEAFRAMGTTWE